MSNQNYLPTRSPTTRADDPALTAWLNDTPQPSTIAIIWRLWLPYARAAALLAELHRTGAPVSVMGLLGACGVRLYLWQHAIAPGLSDQLLTYDPSAILVDAEQIEGGPAWACGRALMRLVAARARSTNDQR